MIPFEHLKEDRVLVMSVNPGWVKTDMGGSNGELTPEQSVSMMIKTMSDMSDSDSGKFVQFDGSSVPW